MLCHLWSVCAAEITFVHKEPPHCLVQLDGMTMCVFGLVFSVCTMLENPK